MSSWDSKWEEVYKSQEWGKYPPEELIRFVAQNYYDAIRNDTRILDVGCGTGAATWFIAREGFSTTGIDGSATAIAKAKKRFKEEDLNGDFLVGDIEKINYPDDYFDAVTDTVAIQHNTYEKILEIVKETHRVLKPGGKLYSMMVQKGSYGYGLGFELEKNTFDQVSEGPYAGKGIIHFTDANEIKDIFSIFEAIDIECSMRTFNNFKNKISHFVITATK